MKNINFIKTVLSITVILKHTIHSTTSTPCNNMKYWCHKTQSGLIYLDQRFPIMNQATYKTCLEICTGNVTCKTFEYNSDSEQCMFSSLLIDNVPYVGTATYEVFWKTSIDAPCKKEVNNQGKSTLNS